MARKPDARSDAARAYRHLYSTARWREARALQLQRQPLCEECQSQGRVTPATVCNHIDPATKASEVTFFAGPFSSACKPCHDSLIQRQEKRGHIIGCDVSGVPLDAGHHWNRG